MFKKYTALAAAMLLASSAALAERPGIQGSCTTCSTVCSENQHCNTTCRQAFSTPWASDPTSQDFCTTCWDCNPTSEPICSGSSSFIPTAFPLQAPSNTPAPSQPSSPGDDYTTQSVSAQEQMMMNLLNMDRKNNGLSPLTLDPALCRIARIKSEDMRDNRYFAHESPTYGNVRDMLKRFGYAFTGAGENIAHHANVDKAQAAFMSSPGHRKNILSTAWTKAGIGICLDANGFIYATQIFAR